MCTRAFHCLRQNIRKSIVPFASSACSIRLLGLSSQIVTLNYQEPPPPGKRTGRYVNQPDKGDLVDKNNSCETTIRDGRNISPPATLETMGFSFQKSSSQCKDFRDDEEIVATYYREMIQLVKEVSGAASVYVFDHTVRESSNTNLNAEAGGSAAPVPRVHCDYTIDGAPRRLIQLGKEGIFSRRKGRDLTDDEVAVLAARRFAFINVWRSIDPAQPIQQKPLAVCNENSVPLEDKFLYEIAFPDRTGENYSLKFNKKHEWYYYPEMTAEECLIFKVYDKKENGPRFVFHTAFDDPRSPPDAAPRISIEARAIAFY